MQEVRVNRRWSHLLYRLWPPIRPRRPRKQMSVDIISRVSESPTQTQPGSSAADSPPLQQRSQRLRSPGKTKLRKEWLQKFPSTHLVRHCAPDLPIRNAAASDRRITIILRLP